MSCMVGVWSPAGCCVHWAVVRREAASAGTCGAAAVAAVAARLLLPSVSWQALTPHITGDTEQ